MPLKNLDSTEGIMFRIRSNAQEIENSLASLVSVAISLVEDNDYNVHDTRNTSVKNGYYSLYQTTYQKIHNSPIPEEVIPALPEFILQRFRCYRARHEGLSTEEMIVFFQENIKGTYSEPSTRRAQRSESTPPVSDDDEPGSTYRFG